MACNAGSQHSLRAPAGTSRPPHAVRQAWLVRGSGGPDVLLTIVPAWQAWGIAHSYRTKGRMASHPPLRSVRMLPGSCHPGGAGVGRGESGIGQPLVPLGLELELRLLLQFLE